ncbi:DNA gyrase subunit B [Kitasatospora sp. NPDC096147]|uniref:DNA gyrase subunit B n=1 Tax=Kitasatospora sp. NPDC096147 TaxID=3364093 RepID=UPI0037FA3625
MSTENHGYEASAIQVLDGREVVRKRPAMYIGTTGERGLHRLAFEVAEHAAGMVLAGAASRVDVTLLPDDGLRVTVDGGTDPAELRTALTVTAGGCGRLGRNGLSLGFGPLLYVVNALSVRLEVEVRQAGTRWNAQYSRGYEVSSTTGADPAGGSELTMVFRPDSEIFETTEFSHRTLADRFRELSFLYRDLEITITDERGPSAPERLRFRGELRDFVVLLDGERHPEVIAFHHEDPRMAGELDVALRWRRDGGEARVRSFANGYRTEAGGTHEEGLLRGLRSALKAHARPGEPSPADGPDVGWAQLAPGLTAVVSVKLDGELRLEGCTRDALGNVEVAACVEEAVHAHVAAWLSAHPAEAEALVGRMLPSLGGPDGA